VGTVENRYKLGIILLRPWRSDGQLAGTKLEAERGRAYVLPSPSSRALSISPFSKRTIALPERPPSESIQKPAGWAESVCMRNRKF
jgi:hypothetical protein